MQTALPSLLRRSGGGAQPKPEKMFALPLTNLHPLYSSTTNKMQRYTTVFITIIALHVSGGSSVHHQGFKTVYTASGICRSVIIQYSKLLTYKM